MIRVVAFAVVCALAAAQLNISNVDKNILRKLSSLVNSNKTIDIPAVTALNSSLSNDLVVKLGSLVDLDIFKVKNDSKADDTEPYDVYEVPGKQKPSIMPVEESPDYASSLVLASDLLSLTSAVSNLKEEGCRKHGLKFLDGLLLNKRWALKMFDASSKSPQGLLFGSSYHLGNFDECVGTKGVEDELEIEGQYCLATIRWPQPEENKKIRTGRGDTIRWAVCVPSACDAQSVQDFVSGVISRTVGNTTTVEVTNRDCYAREPLTVSTLDVAYLSVILFFVAILSISTMYEIISITCVKNKKTITHELIVSFSAIHNVKKIISTKQNTNLGLECISGIKALAMIFILAGHTSLFVGTGPVMDTSGWDSLIRNPLLSLVTNSMLLVDTFLMISAFLFCRLLLIELDKRGKLNILPILIFRYIRLTPAYLAVVFFYITWFPKIGEGPLWKNKILLEKDRCEKNWWTNILYINNYVDVKNMCMFQSWYLSVDTQLFFIAPIFIYSLWKWRRVGPSILGFAIFVATLVPVIITYMKNLDPTLLVYAKELYDIISNYYFHTAYIKTHMKMLSYFMGLLTGYLLHRIQKEKYELSRTIKIIGWTVSIILGSMTVFTVSIFYQDWYTYDNIEAAAYTSLPRLAWGISNGWLIIACATGNGGILTKLFTWKFLIPFSRLTYCAYLVNGIVELFAVGELRHPLHLDIVNVTFTCISHIIVTFTIGMLLCIIFESPIHGIEKILLRMIAQPVLSDHALKNKPTASSRSTCQSRLES